MSTVEVIVPPEQLSKDGSLTLATALRLAADRLDRGPALPARRFAVLVDLDTAEIDVRADPASMQMQ